MQNLFQWIRELKSNAVNFGCTEQSNGSFSNLSNSSEAMVFNQGNFMTMSGDILGYHN